MVGSQINVNESYRNHKKSKTFDRKKISLPDIGLNHNNFNSRDSSIEKNDKTRRTGKISFITKPTR